MSLKKAIENRLLSIAGVRMFDVYCVSKDKLFDHLLNIDDFKTVDDVDAPFFKHQGRRAILFSG